MNRNPLPTAFLLILAMSGITTPLLVQEALRRLAYCAFGRFRRGGEDVTGRGRMIREPFTVPVA